MTDTPQTAAPMAAPLSAVLKAATPGPWNKIVKMDRFTAVGAETLVARVYSAAFGDLENEAANAALIASAPTLAAEIATLRQRNAALEKALREVTGWVHAWRTDGKPNLLALADSNDRARTLLAKSEG